MTYISVNKIRGHAEPCVLTVGDDELGVGDDENAEMRGSATGRGRVQPPGQGQHSRLTCPTRRAQVGGILPRAPKK